MGGSGGDGSEGSDCSEPQLMMSHAAVIRMTIIESPVSVVVSIRITSVIVCTHVKPREWGAGEPPVWLKPV